MRSRLVHVAFSARHLPAFAFSRAPDDSTQVVRVRQNLGKYRIDKRLAEGGFAVVFRAYDTIEGIPVALKIPHEHLMTRQSMDDFRKEVRLNARLDHPNILPIKNAGYIDDHFVIVYPLGLGTLGDRLQKRLAVKTALIYTDQILEAVAYAHKHRVAHLDLKPENFILFPNDRLRLADFGIAKIAHRTINASGAGTVGFIAPEQAMGKPSLRSDVFSLGLLIYRMFSGQLPEWPFDWPPPGHDRLQKQISPKFIALLERALSVDHRERFKDAQQMNNAYRRIRPRSLKRGAASTVGQRSGRGITRRNWKTVRVREFLRQFRVLLNVRSKCRACGEPVSEFMQACPWCGTDRDKHHGETKLPATCPRCCRGVKLDWKFCAWCYGPAIGPLTNREYTDKSYIGRCQNRQCSRKLLLPFTKYCPWCRQKVRKPWLIPGHRETCDSCGWGVLREFWEYCPWCGKPTKRR